MKKVKLLFKDSNHPSNRDIVAFLIQNLDKFNQVGILVDFRIVSDAELPALRKRGVTKLPILVVGGKKIYERSSEIKDALKQLYIHNGKTGGPEASKKYESGDPDEQLREYMETDLNMDAWEDDDGNEGDQGNNHMDKVIAMAAQRTKARMERGGTKYSRPTKRSKEERHREQGEGKPGKRKHRSRKERGGGGGGESESAVERIQRQSGGGGGGGGAPPTRDDQLMMDNVCPQQVA
jgi:hypothetical protein